MCFVGHSLNASEIKKMYSVNFILNSSQCLFLHFIIFYATTHAVNFYTVNTITSDCALV